MFFTQDDYKKIQQWLIKNSVKDTEFSEANIPFNGNEIVSIVQGDQNKKVFLKDLVSQIFNLGISDFVNITDKYDAPNISLEEAIRLIPSRARKEGQVITFLDREDHWHIYQFKGVLNQWNVLDTWEDLFDWEKIIIDSILPDEEDLTKSLPDENGNSYLSLKDREYNPEDFSGLGRIILRKNIVEIEDPIYGKVKKNYLYQDMFTQSNTIYEIRYDFDLNGAEITIPEGCVLDFQGGSIDNGSIIFDKTYIKGVGGFKYNIITKGNVANEYITNSWFECPSDDAINVLKNIARISTDSDKDIIFNTGEYTFKNDGKEIINFTRSVDFANSTINLDTNGCKDFFLRFSNSNIVELDLTNGLDLTFKELVNNKVKKSDITKEFKDTLIEIESKDIEFRDLSGNSYNQKELIYIDKNGYVYNEYFNEGNFGDVTKVSIIDCSKQISIKNAIFNVIDDCSDIVSGYRYIGLRYMYCTNLHVDNIIFNCNVDKYRLIYNSVQYNFNANFTNCNFSNTQENTSTSAYIFDIENSIRVNFDNVYVSNISGSWGCFGSNYITDWRINNCVVNRIDTHYRLNNLTVRDSKIGNKGISYTGFGTILVENSTFYTGAIFFPRIDQGLFFKGDIILNNCKLVVPVGASDIKFVYLELQRYDYSFSQNDKFNYMVGTNLIINNIIIEASINLNIYPIFISRGRNDESYIIPKRTIATTIIKNCDFSNYQLTICSSNLFWDYLSKNPSTYIDNTKFSSNLNYRDLSYFRTYNETYKNCYNNLEKRRTYIRIRECENVRLQSDIPAVWIEVINSEILIPYSYINGLDNGYPTRATYRINGCTITPQFQHSITENWKLLNDVVESAEFTNCNFDIPYASVESQRVFSFYDFVDEMEGRWFGYIKSGIYFYNCRTLNNLVLKYGRQRYSTEMILSYYPRKNGFSYYNYQLGKPIWWTGEMWVDCNGEKVVPPAK